MIWNSLSPVLFTVNVLSNFKSLYLQDCIVNFLLLYLVLSSFCLCY